MFTGYLGPGEALGAYRIVSHLGSGGMGDVYLAEDPRLGRRVAIKLLSPELASDSSVMRRFEREACAASALNHPSILTIHELGRDGDTTFIVGEYVEGETLRTRLAGGPLPPDQVVKIGAQIASALAVAHAAGIVHRDIKPENVMVRGDGLVKVLDFGLAKLLPRRLVETDAATIERTTEAGAVLGTIEYMAPEQVRGRVVDARSDVFSLGALLYELASGQAPFTGETPSHVMVAILEQDPTPLEDSELWPVISKAMQKDPAARYQTAGEMLPDLQALQSRSGQAGKPVLHKRRMIAAFATAAAIAAVVFFIAFMMRDRGPLPRVPIAVADFDNQTGEKALDGLSGMLITSLEQSRRLSVMTRSRMFDSLQRLGRGDIVRIDESAGRQVAKAEKLHGLVTASVSRLGSLYVIDMKMIDPATNEYVFAGKAEGNGQERIPAMLDTLSERLRLSVKETKTDVRAAAKGVGGATTPNLEAYHHYFLGDHLIEQVRFPEAIAELKKAVELDPAFSLAWSRLAYAAVYSNLREDASRYIANARRFSDGAAEKELLTIAALEAEIAGNPREAIALRLRLLERYPDDQESIYVVGDLSYHAGDYATAREYLRRTLNADSNQFRALEHLIMLGLDTGDPAAVADAERYARQSPSINSSIQLIRVYFAVGRDAEALAVAKQNADRNPEENECIAIRRYIYGLLHAGDREGARREAKRLLLYPEAVRRGRYEGTLAAVAADEGKVREAFELLEKSENIAAANGERGAVGRRRAERALLLALSGRVTEARAAIASLMSGQADLVDGHTAFGTAIFLNDIDAARSLIRDMMPTQAETYRSLLTAAETRGRGNPGAAVDALLHRPFDPFYDWYFAWCALDAGRFDEAEAGAKRLRSGGQWPYFSVPLAEYLLGRIDEARGHREAARKHYQSVLERWSNADPDLQPLVDTKARLARL
jgi:tetratricopeptide (TPR) repeat protein